MAELFVDIKARDENLQRQVAGVKTQLSTFGASIGVAVGNLASSAIERAAGALAGFVSRGIAGASNLAETQSKVNTIFGDSASLLTGLADDLSAKYGLVKQPILDAASSIGLVGKAAGQSNSQAAGMAAQMAKLAADASSFYNVPLEDALQKIRAGLVGESEPLRAFGVLLSEEAVANEALALGLAKSKKEIDDQAKVAARASLITKGLADASGDLERTAGSTANQWRKFTGTLENLAVSVGTSLAPAINEIVNLAGEMASALAAGFEASRGTFQAFAEGVVEWARTIGVAWRNLPDLWEIVTIKAREMGLNIIAVAESIPENLKIVGDWIANNWTNLIADAFGGIQTIFSNLASNLTAAWDAFLDYLSTGEFKVDFRPLLEGFKAATGELPTLARPAFVSLQEEMDAVSARIGDREAKRAQEIADKARAAQAPAKAAAAGAGKKQEEFKSETVGLAEFSARLREKALGRGEDTAKKQLDEQQKTRVATEKLAELVGGGALAARFT